MSEKKRNIFLLCSTHSDSQLWHDLSKSIQDKFKLVGMVVPDDSHIFNNKQDFNVFKHKELYTGKVQNGTYRNGDIDSHTIEKYRPLYFEMLERISLKRNALSRIS